MELDVAPVEGIDYFYCEVADECQRQDRMPRMRCELWGRCCESPRRKKESDHDWLRRTRPWVAYNRPEDEP